MNYEAWRITYQSSEQAARAAFDMAVEARAELDALRNQDQVAIKLGSYGAAFDGPCTKRAYTYEHQPGNVVALKLGRAAAQASFERGGDFIDFGLSLLRALAEEGFGVFDMGAEFFDPAPPAPSVPEGWGAGVRAVAQFIDKKAEQYALTFGHDDMGGLSFGRGERAEYKMDYYTSMLELADEVRGILAASPLTVCAACERAQKDYAILERVTDDLAVLVQRLVRCLRKAAPDSELPDQATDYLRRKSLQGSPLRDERVTSNSIGVEAVCVVVDGFDGKRLDWLIEGGLDDLPEGATLIFARQAITDADGWGEVFLAAPQPERSE